MTIWLHTYLAGINQTPWGQMAYRIQNVQHTPDVPESLTIDQKIEEFQKKCTEEYAPAITQIKRDFGWYLPENEQNEDDYQIAYLADWYEYVMKQPLKDTIFLNLRSDEQKIQSLTAWEETLQDFIQTHYTRPAISAKTMP